MEFPNPQYCTLCTNFGSKSTRTKVIELVLSTVLTYKGVSSITNHNIPIGSNNSTRPNIARVQIKRLNHELSHNT